MTRFRLIPLVALVLVGLALLPATTAWTITGLTVAPATIAAGATNGSGAASTQLPVTTQRGQLLAGAVSTSVKSLANVILLCSVVGNCRPIIKGLLPQSVFRPGGTVFVTGSNFGARSGKLWVQLQDYTGRWQTIQLPIVAWSNTFAAGTLPDNLTGQRDQEGTILVENSAQLPSRPFQAPFAATRDLAVVPRSHIRVTKCDGNGNDKCGGDPGYVPITANHSASGWDPTSGSGSDVYTVAVGGGWVFDHYVWGDEHGINGAPGGFAPGQAGGVVTINWFYDAGGQSAWYNLDLVITGPIGVPF
jgi:hypothetical protein